ncbi:MAG TPA: DUF433 domain-containing protein [Anaerolineae bacterium]|nr:DUF433 domain-containing protein [Anaerolineae bacterium]
MEIVETRYEHVTLDHDRVPILSGTNMKVVELVVEQLAHGWSAEEIHFQHPYLTLGQIYSALAYYWDHKAELDLDIERRVRAVDQARRATEPADLIDRVEFLPL